MENGKKKKIILISGISIGILVIILLLILFLATDIFKSSQQLFYKYLPQNSKLIEIISSDLSSAYNEKKTQNPYASSGEITLTYEGQNQEEQTLENTNQEVLKIVTESKVDNNSQKQYNKVALTKNSQELLSVKYLKTNELYALASDQIVTKYIAVKNENLKEFAKKLGSKDTTQIPNKIENIDLSQLLQLSQEEKNFIINKYATLLAKNINKSNFNKNNKTSLTIDGQNYKANKYTLTLTTQEIQGLVVKALQELQNDEKTLTIILNKYYLLANNEEMTIEMLKQQIQKLQQDMEEKEIENSQIQISLYVSDSKLLKTEIAKGENIYSVQYTDGAREKKMVINLGSNVLQGFDTIEFRKSESDEQYVLVINISNSQNAQNTISLQISKVGNVNSNNIRTLDILTIKQDSAVYTLKYSDNVNFENNIQIDELDQENSITLNEYSQEELQQLINAIIQRTTQVWQESMKKLTSNEETTENNITNEGTQEENLENTEQTEQELTSTQRLAIDMFNEQFMEYLGESIKSDKVKELLNITKTAIQNQNEIKVTFDGTYNSETIQQEVTTIEEIENLEKYIMTGKTYDVQGLADTTGKLIELSIKENVNNT